MPSVLQGGPKPTPMAPPAMHDPAGALQPAQGQDDGKQLIASIYEKPDGTYCTEDATGQIQEFPDMQSAIDSIEQMGGMGDQDDMSAPAPKAPATSGEGKDYD